MGIGRREFLKLTSIALAGLAVNPLQAVVTNDNVYVNRKLGILFEKPDLWNFVGVKDFGKLKHEQILGNDWEEDKEGHLRTYTIMVNNMSGLKARQLSAWTIDMLRRVGSLAKGARYTGDIQKPTIEGFTPEGITRIN